jgi:capsular exopolysaccharide synthesis family protein
MRTNLQNLRRERPVKTILFTSSNPGEGKTTSIANLAVVLAQMDKTVILLDADLRKPTIHLVFDVKLEPGLSNALANNLKPESVIQRTKIDRLSVISCGDIPGNPGELLSSDAMKKMLDRLTQSYDYVLIDSPPVFAAADPIVLARMSDLVVVVVAAGDTRTNELESTVEALGEVNDGKPGVVVNKFDLQYAYGMTYGRHAYGHYRYEYSKKSENSDRGQGTGQEGPAPGGVVESK